MTKLCSVVTAVVLAFLIAAPTGAAEIKGVVKSINARVIVVETTNAGQVNSPAGIAGNAITVTVPGPGAGQTDMLIGVVPGITVTVTYETAGNVNTASKVVR